MAKRPKADPPVHVIRAGSVVASIWLNTSGEGRPFHTVTFSTNYLDDGKWKNGHSFTHNQLLTLSQVSQMAWSWIHSKEHDDNKSIQGVSS